MELKKASVEHIRWGDGQIVRQVDNVITVRFAGVGEKRFLYPDAFDRHLVLCDPARRQAISLDVAQWKAGEAAREAAERARLEEAARLRAQEKAARKKPVKRTTGGSR